MKSKLQLRLALAILLCSISCSPKSGIYNNKALVDRLSNDSTFYLYEDDNTLISGIWQIDINEEENKVVVLNSDRKKYFIYNLDSLSMEHTVKVKESWKDFIVDSTDYVVLWDTTRVLKNTAQVLSSGRITKSQYMRTMDRFEAIKFQGNKVMSSSVVEPTIYSKYINGNWSVAIVTTTNLFDPATSTIKHHVYHLHRTDNYTYIFPHKVVLTNEWPSKYSYSLILDDKFQNYPNYSFLNEYQPNGRLLKSVASLQDFYLVDTHFSASFRDLIYTDSKQGLIYTDMLSQTIDYAERNNFFRLYLENSNSVVRDELIQRNNPPYNIRNEYRTLTRAIRAYENYLFVYIEVKNNTGEYVQVVQKYDIDEYKLLNQFVLPPIYASAIAFNSDCSSVYTAHYDDTNEAYYIKKVTL